MYPINHTRAWSDGFRFRVWLGRAPRNFVTYIDALAFVKAHKLPPDAIYPIEF